MNKDSIKKKEGNVFVCPICVEVIVESTETTEGQDAIFCLEPCTDNFFNESFISQP